MQVLRAAFIGLGIVGMGAEQPVFAQTISDKSSMSAADRLAHGFSQISQQDFNELVGKADPGIAAQCKSVAKRLKGIVSPLERPRLIRKHRWCLAQ